MEPIDRETDLKLLKENRLLRTDKEFDQFESALARLATVIDDTIVQGLCEAFDDATADDEVMFGLVHAVEAFQGDAALIALAECIPSMLPHAHEWAKILHYRILNSENHRRWYKSIIANDVDDETRRIIVHLFQEIKEEDPERFKNKVDEVLAGKNGRI